MCGRYSLRTPAEALKRQFDLTDVPEDLAPRYNIAPSQQVAVIPNRPVRRLEMFRWGLVPSWAKDSAIGNRMINARAETLADKPSFKTPLRTKRCLVLADGFYEWKGSTSPKMPMYIRMKSGEPFAFAGLWDEWRGPDAASSRSCTIVTTTPNALIAAIHDRMPVILPPEAIDTWLTPGPRDLRDLTGLLVPFDDEQMEAYEVSRLVNAPANDTPECTRATSALEAPASSTLLLLKR